MNESRIMREADEDIEKSAVYKAKQTKLETLKKEIEE